jgi:hypothetical protein
MAFSRYVSDVIVFHLKMARRGRKRVVNREKKVTPINSQLRSQVYLKGIRIHNATGCTPQGWKTYEIIPKPFKAQGVTNIWAKNSKYLKSKGCRISVSAEAKLLVKSWARRILTSCWIWPQWWLRTVHSTPLSEPFRFYKILYCSVWWIYECTSTFRLSWNYCLAHGAVTRK